MNLGQLKTGLQALGYGADVGSVAAEVQAFNDVYRELAGLRRWPWLEAANTSLTTTIGNPAVSVAGVADLLHVDAVRIEAGTAYYDLDYLSQQELRAREHVDRDNGIPKYWSEINGQIKLYPRPDKVYTLDVDYLKDPPDLSSDGDTPLFDATYHDIMIWGAAVSMAYRERDLAAAGFAQQKYDRIERMMLAAYGVSQRQTSDRVRHNQKKYGRFAA